MDLYVLPHCFPTRGASDLLSGGDIARDRITPEAAGLPAHDRDAIRGGDAAFNAQALRKLLAGERSAYRDAVLMNAAGALIVADAAGTWHGGAARAAEAIDSGRAAALLDRWIAFRWATQIGRAHV